MGIKHFFPWLKNNFKTSIYYIKKNRFNNGYIHIPQNIKYHNEAIHDKRLPIIDNLLIDLNGMIHTSAQKIFKYGKYEEKHEEYNIYEIAKAMGVKGIQKENMQNNTPTNIHTNTPKTPTKHELYELVFADICSNLVGIINVLKPSKRLVIHIDGPAPKAKQNQQRQRRFRAAYEKQNDKTEGNNEPITKEWRFQSSCMSPGTKYMEAMSSYVKTYFISYCRQNNLGFIFSDDKYPGEGEHKCMKFAIENDWNLRGDNEKNIQSESYCIYGNDADLIMLTIGTHVDNFYILRDDMYNEGNFYFLNIDTIKAKLFDLVKWEDMVLEEKKQTMYINCLNDFIFMCFMVGNDFLPNIPSLEILSTTDIGSTKGGIDLMLDIYHQVGKKYGHLTYNLEGYSNHKHLINKRALVEFLYCISSYERELAQNKYDNKNFFPDTLLNDSVYKGKINLELYKEVYHDKKLNVKSENDLSQICHEYLEGLHWILKYYIKHTMYDPVNPHYDVPSWNWCYNHHYAPFASDLFKYVSSYRFKSYINTKPHLPYEQLLSILPPASKELLPKDMRSIFTNEKLKQFYPESIILDKSGKRKEWEAITIVPVIDHKLLKKEYKKAVKEMEIKCPEDLKRNVHNEIYVQ